MKTKTRGGKHTFFWGDPARIYQRARSIYIYIYKARIKMYAQYHCLNAASVSCSSTSSSMNKKQTAKNSTGRRQNVATTTTTTKKKIINRRVASFASKRDEDDEKMNDGNVRLVAATSAVIFRPQCLLPLRIFSPMRTKRRKQQSRLLR